MLIADGHLPRIKAQSEHDWSDLISNCTPLALLFANSESTLCLVSVAPHKLFFPGRDFWFACACLLPLPLNIIIKHLRNKCCKSKADSGLHSNVHRRALRPSVYCFDASESTTAPASACQSTSRPAHRLGGRPTWSLSQYSQHGRTCHFMCSKTCSGKLAIPARGA